MIDIDILQEGDVIYIAEKTSGAYKVYRCKCSMPLCEDGYFAEFYSQEWNTHLCHRRFERVPRETRKMFYDEESAFRYALSELTVKVEKAQQNLADFIKEYTCLSTKY